MLEAGWWFLLHIQGSLSLQLAGLVCSFRGQVQLLERQIKLAEALCYSCVAFLRSVSVLWLGKACCW